MLHPHNLPDLILQIQNLKAEEDLLSWPEPCYICPTTMLLSILFCLNYNFLPPNKIQIKITSNISELQQSLN